MAKNITLMGANYPDVPAVDLPQTGGGTARFVDVDEAVTAYRGRCAISAQEVNTQKNFYFTLPTGIDSSYIPIVCFGTPINTANYTGRIFGKIENNTLRIGLKVDTDQTYEFNVIFAKDKGTLTAT